MCAVFFLSRKRDAKLFQSYVNQKDYLTAKNVFQEKHKNYLLGGLRIIVDYYTLISCFALNDIDDARTLLIETRWGFFHRQIKYFEVLLNLKDNDLESARRNADILVGNPPKGSLNQINKMKQIFVCIDNDNFEDKFYLDSAYPIVKEIYDFYLSKKVGQ
jgi:hypothetical protein